MEEMKNILIQLKETMDTNNSNTNKKLDNIQECLTPLKLQVEFLNKKVDIFDKNNRRKNLIVHGLQAVENGTKSQHDLENEITNLFNQKLQMTDFTKHEIDFVRRMGTSNDVTPAIPGPRPVIVGLTTERRKHEILRNSNKLKNTKIYIHQDLTEQAREERKQLVKQMKEERARGNFVVIRKNKLVSDDDKSNKTKRALSESPNDKIAFKRPLFQSNLTDYISQNTSHSSNFPKNGE
uniref:Endonuclease-reverse transcriptase n=1 Tax=Cacopsylla melanoneura TaxID=428564 RepID=A0A8D8X8Y2_9HEMI